MKKFFVLQHSEHESLGIWEEELKRWRVRYDYIEIWKGEPLPAPKDTLAVIILGGPQSVNAQDQFPILQQEVEYLRALAQDEIHILGVCLGAQLLAKALGAEVRPGPGPEMGYTQVTLTLEGPEDPLLRGFPMTLPVFQWHQEGFDLPPESVCLAGSNEYPQQAFRHGHAWGFQFHLEVTPSLVDGIAAQHAAELDKIPGLSRQKLAEQAATKGQVVTLYGRQVIRRFWDSVTEV